MTCAPIRHRILVLEDPSELPPDLQDHVAHCEACHAWHRNLLRVERSIPRVPVPASSGKAKAALLQMFQAKPASRPAKTPAAAKPSPTVPVVQPPNSGMRRNKPTVRPVDATPEERPSWSQRAARLWPAGLIAATLLIGTVAYVTFKGNRVRPGESMPADPMLDGVVQLNLEIAQARTAEERLLGLAKLSEELHQEMRDIARVDATGESMVALQEMYRKVVMQGILQQAKLVSGTAVERRAFLEQLASRLNNAGTIAEAMATEVPQTAVKPLREVADVARQGQRRLRDLMEGV